MNFAYLKNAPDFAQLYTYCCEAEDFALEKPNISVTSARKAMEFLVKMIYRAVVGETQGKTVFEMSTDNAFVSYLNDPVLLNSIHYIRKMGNVAVHDGTLTTGEAVKVLEELHFLVGEVCILWQLVPDYPEFVKPTLQAPAQPAPVQAPGAKVEVAPELCARYAERMRTTRFSVAHRRDENENKKLFLYASLRESGWPIVNRENTALPGAAAVNCLLDSGDSVDYILYGRDNKPLAVIEQTATAQNLIEGRAKGIDKANQLAEKYGDKPVVYYTNGYYIYCIDQLGYPPRRVFNFHSIEELELLKLRRTMRQDIANPRIDDAITNRDYQKNAIRNVCKAFRDLRRRSLLVMATGTGKTRVAISCVDVLMKANWVKNVLFLADRTSLVRQAHKNFNKLLPNVTTSLYTGGSLNRDPNARVIFSTYQTMIGHLDKDAKTFSLGRFDLIIIDEAHRSVFGKYGAIFEYFDGLLLGLTATPRDEVDRSTYDLFGMEQGEPTDSYEYDEAVADGYLKPFRAIKDNSKILTEGIDPDQLTPEEREQLDEIFEYEKMKAGLEPGDPYSRIINATEIFKYIYNHDTVDYVLNRLMNDGIRVKDDTLIGKTIIFAYNHKHAVLIAERFAVLYPDLGPDFCRVIDDKEKYSSDLIDKFADVERLPQIAVSVDMLDTGIDVPEIVNLVFFKPIHSKIKFWQMIGRGTRLCENLFGEGKDKEEFLIFDFYRNFEYFEMNPEGAKPAKSQSIVSLLFNLRTDIKFALQDGTHQSKEESRAFHDNLADILHQQIANLNRNRIDVRLQLKAVETYATPEAMVCLTLGDVMAMKGNISPLFKNAITDISALKFDALVLKSQLALVDETVNSTSSERKIMDIAGCLKEKKASIPQVMAKMDVLNEVLSARFWESKSLGSLERIRLALRDLIQYMDGGTGGQTFIINVTDTFEEDNSGVNVTPIRTYRRRVEDYLKEHLSDDDALQKIYHLEPLSGQDITRLELIFWEELGSKAEFEAQTRTKPYQHNVAAFIRSIIGVEQEVALEKYRALIHGAELTRMQEEYLRMLIRYVCENGDIATVVLQQPPFNKFPVIFRDSRESLIDYVKLISQVIAV